jgi:DNA-binding NtrC family response regulator
MNTVIEHDSKHTLLIVDDEERILASLTRLFRNEQFELRKALSGAAALDILRANPIDVVLCDETMPGMRGTELLRVIKDRWPDTVRLMMTGNADLELALLAINQGEAYRFIQKPWNDTELRIMICQAFEKVVLLQENRRLTDEVRHQQNLFAHLEAQFPGITNLNLDKHGCYIATAGQRPQR